MIGRVRQVERHGRVRTNSQVRQAGGHRLDAGAQFGVGRCAVAKFECRPLDHFSVKDRTAPAASPFQCGVPPHARRIALFPESFRSHRRPCLIGSGPVTIIQRTLGADRGLGNKLTYRARRPTGHAEPIRSVRPSCGDHWLQPRHRPRGRRIMASLGAKMVVSSRKADACEEVAAGINKAGGEAIVIPCNISRKNESRAHQRYDQPMGPDRHLVCNAAVNPYYGPLAGSPDDAFDKIMSSNIKSNLWLRILAMPEMAEKGAAASSSCRRSAACAAPPILAPTASPRRPTCSWPATSRRMGTQEHPHQLHRARAGEDRLRPRLWEDPESLEAHRGDARPCAASASPTRSAASSRSSPPRRPRS